MATTHNLFREAVDAGGLPGCFRLMEPWTVDQLNQCMMEADAFCGEVSQLADAQWTRDAVRPRIFFSPMASKALDDARNEMKMQALAVAAEICSVAAYYLDAHGAARACEGVG